MHSPALHTLALTASDTLAVSLIALLSFALGVILTILIVMARTGKEPPPIEEDLFADEEEQNVEVGEQPADSREPWEQDPDWWRK